MVSRFRISPCFVLASFLLSAGAAGAQQVQVKVGVACPLTGANAAYGKDLENGVQLALDEANAAHPVIGGQQVKFVIDSQDDQADPRIGVQAAQRLVDDHVAVVVGHFNSGTTIPASAVYAKAGIPMITPAATNPAITQAGYGTVYMVIATDAQNAGNAGVYAATVTKAKRIAIIDDRTAFGQGEADEFAKAAQAHGAAIVDREYTDDKAVDFSSQLTAIKSHKPDLVFFGGLDAQAAQMVKRMRQLGMRAQFLGGGGVKDANFIKIAGKAAEGAEAWEYGRPLASMSKGKGFEAKFKKRFGMDVLAYAQFAYDATGMAIKAMEKANSVDPAKYNPVLKASSYDGVTGNIQFTKNGSLKNPSSTLYKVKHGAWVVVTTKTGV